MPDDTQDSGTIPQDIESALALLSSDRWQDLANAAKYLGDAKYGGAAGRIAELLNHWRVDVRKAAYQALMNIGQAAVPGLIDVLATGDSITSYEARSALINIGEPALPTIIERFKSAEPPLRTSLATVLGAFPQPESIEVLIWALGEPYGSGAAYSSLAQIGRAGVPALKQASNDENAERRAAAIELLGLVDQEGIQRDLDSLLKDENAVRRRQAVAALGSMPGENGLPTLFDIARNDPVLTVRWAAVNGLERKFAFIPSDQFPELIEIAIDMQAVELIKDISRETPTVTHPHLDKLFALGDLEEAYMFHFAPWHESGTLHLDFLRGVIESDEADRGKKVDAWLALLHTRHPVCLEYAYQQAEKVEMLNVEAQFRQVGQERIGEGVFRQLYPEWPYHLVFTREYLYHPAYLEQGAEAGRIGNEHPTWHFDQENPGLPWMRVGGRGRIDCGECEGGSQHLITLDPIPDDIGVTGLARLTLEACLQCLPKYYEPLTYRHDADGLPAPIGERAHLLDKDSFVSPAKETQVWLAKADPRWKWHDWDHDQNLHRVGGAPIWIQDNRYMPCPECGQTMAFLMQLDSDLPPESEESWFWGAEGFFYILWCDACKISSIQWDNS